jgi:hypothetical protein
LRKSAFATWSVSHVHSDLLGLCVALPDPTVFGLPPQRQLIWRRQLPPKVKLEEDVDITALALKFELSGGYIRNAVQAALSRCVPALPCFLTANNNHRRHLRPLNCGPAARPLGKCAAGLHITGRHIHDMRACVCRSTARGCAGPEDVRLCQADLLHGAKLQLRGALRMKVSGILHSRCKIIC